MNGTDWDAIERIFQVAIELPASERERCLDDRCAGAPHVRTQVASLLAAHDASTDFLAPLGTHEDLRESAGPQVGSRLGAYRLVREIGHGGMGTVYLARRADEDFEHDVAIKVTRSPVSDPDVARRFVRERQMLAALHHPHIVTLLDAGTTPSGHAYLVMEYVDGSRVTDWLRERAASLEDRLRLFRQVCSAVHAAHQQGIVHRDLKPANILVTAAGVPKVLDFGIARLLPMQAGAGATQTGWGQGPLTPDYASPEQLRGLPASVAGDVYSLGVLLFEMLAASRPYETTGKTVDQLLDHVLRGPTRRVSVAAAGAGTPYAPARLRGDLDAIVQKAMQVESADRYASAEDLSDDVARWLGGKPIIAREPSLQYVVRKLVAQHRGVVVAAVVGVVGILAALGVALWQRQQAIEQRARAEARFDDVRTLANALIFTIHDAVALLPGSTEARRLIASEALGYLDTLAGSGGDDSLRLELAKGYKQVARALGDPTIANLGDHAGAVHNLARAIAIIEPLQQSALWREAGLERVHALRVLASVEQSRGNAAEGLRMAHLALEQAKALNGRAPADVEIRRALASAHFNVALNSMAAAAISHWESAGRLFEALWREAPDDPDRMRNVALVDKYYARLLIDRGRVEEGTARYRRALELDERQLARQPDARQTQFDVAIDLANMGTALYGTGRRPEAFDYFRRSIAMRERLVAADPRDRSARLALVRLLAQMALYHLSTGDMVAARKSVDRARQLAGLDERLAQDANYQRDDTMMVFVDARLARADGDRAGACHALRRATRLAASPAQSSKWNGYERAFFRDTAAAVGTCR